MLLLLASYHECWTTQQWLQSTFSPSSSIGSKLLHASLVANVSYTWTLDNVLDNSPSWDSLSSTMTIWLGGTSTFHIPVLRYHFSVCVWYISAVLRSTIKGPGSESSRSTNPPTTWNLPCHVTPAHLYLNMSMLGKGVQMSRLESYTSAEETPLALAKVDLPPAT